MNFLEAFEINVSEHIFDYYKKYFLNKNPWRLFRVVCIDLFFMKKYRRNRYLD